MLNEKRVKHMVKLALYESKDGAEELKISSYFKKDYVNSNMIWSILWMTVAYIIIAALIVVTCLQVLLKDMSFGLILSLVLAFVAAYGLMLITYIVLSRKHYKKKHARAYHRVKRFKKGLEILEDMYREEEQ
ncbi:MAG: hypothetical protein IJZ53_13945 [Tyzzerella sp.]|nr:hypothetical protein [Tyzzerella sp.]